jgi:hypothetical protein
MLAACAERQQDVAPTAARPTKRVACAPAPRSLFMYGGRAQKTPLPPLKWYLQQRCRHGHGLFPPPDRGRVIRTHGAGMPLHRLACRWASSAGGLQVAQQTVLLERVQALACHPHLGRTLTASLATTSLPLVSSPAGTDAAGRLPVTSAGHSQVSSRSTSPSDCSTSVVTRVTSACTTVSRLGDIVVQPKQAARQQHVYYLVWFPLWCLCTLLAPRAPQRGFHSTSHQLVVCPVLLHLLVTMVHSQGCPTCEW